MPAKRFTVVFRNKTYEMSEGEFYFFNEMKSKLPTSMLPLPEYQFSDGKHRFDFAWFIGSLTSPNKPFKLGVEIEGGTFFGRSRHSTGVGYEQDCHKYNKAIEEGWTLLRYTTRMVTKGYQPTKKSVMIYPCEKVINLVKSANGRNLLLI